MVTRRDQRNIPRLDWTEVDEDTVPHVRYTSSYVYYSTYSAVHQSTLLYLHILGKVRD